MSLNQNQSESQTKNNQYYEELGKETLKKLTFPIVIIAAVILAFAIKGFVLGGMMMGIMSTIAIWVLVLKLPDSIQMWMGRHVLISDLILSISSYTLLASIGPGPTIFMAAATQAVLLSILLTSISPEKPDTD
jgi:hypothetical protein